PPGRYILKERESEKYGEHWQVKVKGGEIPGRSHILIHHGNYKRDIKGCILVGRDHIDIDGDRLRDVTSSKSTMERIHQYLTRDNTPLTIIG
ncbi:MAG: hypothetical protein CMB80_00445, partial [Flammeovirgaceae bacterium]|nr:hypothetical protein [Flammeovirgaceae bacterium]